MPHIINEKSIVSTVYNWQKRDVSKYSTFPSVKPKFRTSDLFSQYWGRLPYRDNLNLAQIYTEFGKIDAIYQQATNACLVLFNQERVAQLVSNKHNLGIPYGRLYTRWWNPLPQDKDQLKLIKHIEKACETRSRFHSLMDEDDRVASRKFLRAGARAMADGNKLGGPHLSAYLYEGVKRIGEVKPLKPKLVKTGRAKRLGEVNVISSMEEFEEAIKGPKLVVVDFYATWCGPCRAISPIIDEWAKEFDDVLFMKIDVDEVPDVCTECLIPAIPTFMFYKNNILLETVVGALQDTLREKILAMK